MRVITELHQNSVYRTWHIQKEMPHVGFMTTEPNEIPEDHKAFIKGLESIPGVTEVTTMAKYEIGIKIGEAFLWNKITPEVEKIIKEYVGEDLEIETKYPEPSRNYYDD